MYRYDEFDARIVKDRVEQFRGQVNRRLSGELLEDEFKPLRLMNGHVGVQLQVHTILQAQRLELVFQQLARQAAGHLPAELFHPVFHDPGIEFIVTIHL